MSFSEIIFFRENVFEQRKRPSEKLSFLLIHAHKSQILKRRKSKMHTNIMTSRDFIINIQCVCSEMFLIISCWSSFIYWQLTIDAWIQNQTAQASSFFLLLHSFWEEISHVWRKEIVCQSKIYFYVSHVDIHTIMSEYENESTFMDVWSVITLTFLSFSCNKSLIDIGCLYDNIARCCHWLHHPLSPISNIYRIKHID